MAYLREAIQTAEATNEGWVQAELHRLLGAAFQTLDRSREAEDCYHRALVIARKQQARWWELQAATSLASLWRDEGKVAEARNLGEEGRAITHVNWFHRARLMETPDDRLTANEAYHRGYSECRTTQVHEVH